MRVFISWSGTRSQAVAEELAAWLPDVIQSAKPFISGELERGVKWLAEIGSNLDGHSLGIIVVTPENVTAPWLNFEAGALSKQISDVVRVIPYLVDFSSPTELLSPLNQFNAALADEQGTRQVVETLNAHAAEPLKDDALARAFDRCWSDLESKLLAVIANRAPDVARPERGVDDKIDEILSLLRQSVRDRQQTALSDELLVLAGVDLQAMVNSYALRNPNMPHNPTIRQILADHALQTKDGDPLGYMKLASRTVSQALVDEGLHAGAMRVISFDSLGVWVYVENAISSSVTSSVRSRLKQALPGRPAVDFYTGALLGEGMMLYEEDPETRSPLGVIKHSVDEGK